MDDAKDYLRSQPQTSGKRLSSSMTPRVFIMEHGQGNVVPCLVQLRAMGLEGIVLKEGEVLECALSQGAPVALLVFVSTLRVSAVLRQQLEHWHTRLGNDCYFTLVSDNDTVAWHQAALATGFDFFVIAEPRYHHIGFRINAFIKQRSSPLRVLMLGCSESVSYVRNFWEMRSVDVRSFATLDEALTSMSAEPPDAILVDHACHPQESLLRPLLAQCVDENLIWWMVSPSGLGDARNPHHLSQPEDLPRVHQLLVRIQLRRLEREERDRYDPDFGLLTFQGLCDHLAPVLRDREQACTWVAACIRLVGFDRRTLFGDFTARAGLRYRIAQELLAEMLPGDWLAVAGDEHLVAVLCITPKRDVKAFADSLSNIVIDRDITFKLGFAPINGIHLSQALADALRALQLPPAMPSVTYPDIDPHTAVSAQDWFIRLKGAIQEKRLSLVFQLILGLETEQIERYEVLLRLNEHGNNDVSAAEFISAARQTGLIRYLDRWVLAESLKALKLRQNAGTVVGLFIKVSIESVLDPSYLPWLLRVIDTSGVAMTHSAIEIPESLFFVKAGEGKQFVANLRNAGIPICITEFGSTDASLNLIPFCTPDYIKLHRQYARQPIRDKEPDLRFKPLMKAARDMGTVVMMGYLESAEALYHAAQNGVSLLQGNVLNQPGKTMEFHHAIHYGAVTFQSLHPF